MRQLSTILVLPGAAVTIRCAHGYRSAAAGVDWFKRVARAYAQLRLTR